MIYVKEETWMKKSWKKRLGILLTASITAATVFPTTAGMAKANDGTPEKVRNHTTATADGLNTVSANLPADVTNGSLPTAASYDIDQPVIESFEMEENGQTLNQNDTLHFKMSAYDAESGIKSVTVTINHKSYSFSRSVTLENSGETFIQERFPAVTFWVTKEITIFPGFW